MVTATRIAESFGLSENALYQHALKSFLLEKKRQVLQQKLEILARYGVNSINELEVKIAQGEVREHPAWEDLIVSENLTANLEELNAYLADLQNTEAERELNDF